jgi:hypothetical protein
MAFDPGGSFVDFRIRVDASEAITSISELNRLFTTYLSLARRTGLPESIVDALSRIYQLQAAIQALHRSILLLEVASGPIGWATALGGIALSAVMITDQALIGSRTR